MRTYPTAVSNRNVPPGAFLVADVAIGSERNVTYYIDWKGELWRVGDWCTDMPERVFLDQLCRLIGDTENMITSRWKSHYRSMGLEVSR
jgi:hypothetical protein